MVKVVQTRKERIRGENGWRSSGSDWNCERELRRECTWDSAESGVGLRGERKVETYGVIFLGDYMQNAGWES